MDVNVDVITAYVVCGRWLSLKISEHFSRMILQVKKIPITFTLLLVFLLAGLSPAIVKWRRAPNKMAKNEVPHQNFPPLSRIATCTCFYLCVYLQYIYVSDVLS